jgi:N-acetylglucosaminyldiphosphoundecaprenol N-acetyl-beta-D-mannosaminyltransferase
VTENSPNKRSSTLGDQGGKRQDPSQDIPGSLPDTVDVLGVPVHLLKRPALTHLLCEMLEQKTRGWISYVNIHAINLAYRLPWYKQFLRESLITYCDGEGVRLGSRILGKPLPERIGLTYWIYDIMVAMEKGGWSVYFLGSTDTVLEKAINVLRIRYPKLRIAGYHNGYLSPEDDVKTVDLINRANPDLLIVGLGMPKQERWILDHFAALRVPLMTNAGSCIESIVSEDLRYRAWMGRVGLEWFYRLLREPGRLWKRYLIGNPLFMARIIRARWQMATRKTAAPSAP